MTVEKKKRQVFLGLAGALLMTAALLVPGWLSRGTLRWARGLSEEQIAKAELVVMPSKEGEQYRLLKEEEFAAVAALLRESRGSYRPHPESLCGGAATLYITLRDGSVHKVTNSANSCLIIDGDAYSASFHWLASWGERCGLERGDSKVPEGFVY